MQAVLAALALALAGGASLLLCGVVLARRRRRTLPLGMDVLLREVPDALGDASLLLDADGCILASSGVAEARLAPGGLRGHRIEELLGDQATLLRKGIDRGPVSGRVELGTGAGEAPAQAVLVRVSARPVRDLLVIRFERSARPPPLPAAVAGPAPGVRAAARVDLAALGAALHGPVREAATAVGLLRLELPAAITPRELQRVEKALEEAERRIRWMQSAGAGPARQLAAVDLASLVGDLVGGVPAWRARLRPHLVPAPAWIDAGRVRTALREVLRTVVEALPAGGEVAVRVGVRSGAALLELGSTGAVGEAAALARALLAPEGGEVEVEAVPGHGGVCRISLPAVSGG